MEQNDLTKIIDEAYELYMPQVRTEILQLANLVKDSMKYELDLCAGREIEVPSSYNVLEIGTKFGGTFYVWNKLVQDHGAGMCISVDLADGIHGGVPAEEMDKRDLWFHERFDNCYFIRGNSHDDDTLENVGDLLGTTWNGDKTALTSNQLDLLFIDGDHSYDGVKQDFEFYSQFCKKNSIIVFHDIIDSQRHREREVFVSLFWNEIKHDPRFESFEIVGDRNQGWAGLGICKVK